MRNAKKLFDRRLIDRQFGRVAAFEKLVLVSLALFSAGTPASAQSILTNGAAQDAPLPFSTHVYAEASGETPAVAPTTSATKGAPQENTTTIGKTTQKDRKKADAKKADDPKVSDKKPTSPNATAALVNMLVEKKIITEDQAADIIKQADDEDYVGREATKDATEQAADAAKAAKDAALAASPPGTKHVAYVPEVVKRQLRDEIKKEVMAQAQRENWASPGKYPEWASRIRISGDIRARYEGIFYPSGNAPGGFFPNFNAINTGNPIDISAGAQTESPYPRYDTDQDRDRFRLRMRVGVDADLDDGFKAGVRLATGDTATPVSTNQTFGGSGGNFSKYAVWLDRAFVSYQPGDDLAVNVGRFDNPFFSPTELVWDKDLGFDGLAIRAKHRISSNLVPFAVAGAFPIFNSNLDFGTSDDFKTSSDDKYLYGAQVGVAWTPDPNIGVRVAAAYYDFDHVKGEESSPCTVFNSSTSCDTDLSRPSFAQRGNTYMSLRNIIPTVENDQGDSSQFQYYGLASNFEDLVITGQVDFAHFHPIHIIVDGEFVDNLAFNKNAIAAVAVNNLGVVDSLGNSSGSFEGGNIGWLVRTTVGHKELNQYGDWNANVGYKYLESDAMVDAFVDSDFGLGGTNLKGYFVGGNYALSHNVSTALTWMSANSIGGPPFAVDVLQVDLNAKF
jgi:Putative porin